MLVFVYGTLADPDRVDDVLDEWAYAGGATLSGLRRVEGRYPTLVPPEPADAPASVEGRLLWTPEVANLDAYEGVDRGLYVRVTVPVRGGTRLLARPGEGPVGDGGRVAVYVGDPDRLDAPAAWPGEGTLGERVRQFVAERDVVVVPADR